MKPEDQAAKLQPLQRFERVGELAIRPQAFFEFFLPPPTDRRNALVGSVEIVDIFGPLTTRAEMWCDSYESIVERVGIAAARQETSTIVLRMDSPGGDAQGMIDAANSIASICQTAGKPIYAYVGAQCCSAAYALACVAARIFVGSTAIVGSIGVLSRRVDFSQQNAARGVNVAFVATGARKLDGNEDAPITDDEMREQQALVGELGAVFFEHVAARRRLSVEAVAGMNGKVFAGRAAVAASLADERASFDELLAKIATGELNMTAMERARAALEEAAKSDDDTVASGARKALSAMDEKDEPAGADDAPDTTDEPKGADDKPEPTDDDKKKDDDDKPAAISKRQFAAITKSIGELIAENKTLTAKLANGDVEAFYASRTDLPATLVERLRALPLEEAKAIAAAIPVAKPPKLPAKPSTQSIKPTQGKTQGVETGPRLSAEAQAKLDARMGLAPAPKLVNKRIGNTTFVGVPEDYQLPSAAESSK
jgi:ClpP class serine protease